MATDRFESQETQDDIAELESLVTASHVLLAETPTALPIAETTTLIVPSNYPTLNKALQLFICGSFNQLWEYMSANAIFYSPYVSMRVTHNINANSTGTIQVYMTDNRTMRVTNQTNEALKIRLYAKY